MATGGRAPQGKLRVFDANGFPLANGKIYTYEPGSTTPAATYADFELTAINENPITLDSRGEANVFLPLESGFKFVYKDANDLLLDTQDNLFAAISWSDMTAYVGTYGGGGGGGSFSGVWIASTQPPTYVAPTQFRLVGDERTNFPVGGRVRAVLAGGAIGGTITTSAYTAPNTLVTMNWDSTAMDPTVSVTAYSVLNVTNLPADAGQVQYTEALPYSTPSVGNKLKLLTAADATTLTTTNGLNTRLTTAEGNITSLQTLSTKLTTKYVSGVYDMGDRTYGGIAQHLLTDYLLGPVISVTESRQCLANVTGYITNWPTSGIVQGAYEMYMKAWLYLAAPGSPPSAPNGTMPAALTPKALQFQCQYCSTSIAIHGMPIAITSAPILPAAGNYQMVMMYEIGTYQAYPGLAPGAFQGIGKLDSITNWFCGTLRLP